MKNLCYRAVTLVISLCFMGPVANSSRKSSIFLSSEYLLANHSTGYLDTGQTAATVDTSFLFFRVLFQTPIQKEWKMKRLDLRSSRTPGMSWTPAPPPALETLNLSSSALHSLSVHLFAARSPRHRLRSSFPQGLPAPKVLILQRNKLRDTPKGLWKLKSLQSLDLSFNEILQIGLSDFHNCLQLESIYLKSNKISRIHPEAFKNLKKLQVVDLSSNVLTTLLPLMIIALEFPHLDVDLAENQWQCEDSIADFQRFLSESWRAKWSVICSRSGGNREAHVETPQIRISRETHLPHTSLSHEQSLSRSGAERSWEGTDPRLSRRGKEDWAGADGPSEMQAEQLAEVRDPHDGPAPDRQEADSSDLTLAVCLSVFVTFLVAFSLGAFTRPYADRLWQQRCRNKSPGSDNAHTNEGFYDEIEAARSMQHRERDLLRASRLPTCYESQNPVWATEPSPDAATIPDGTLGGSRIELSGQPGSGQCRDDTTAASGDGAVPLYSQVALSTPHAYPHAHRHQPTSVVHNHAYSNTPKGLNYDTVAQEYSLHEGLEGVSSIASPVLTVSGSTPSEWDELKPSDSEEVAAFLSLARMNMQGAGESKGRRCPEPLEATDLQMGSSEGRQIGYPISLRGTQLPEFPKASYGEVTCSDPPDQDSPALLPRWDNGLTVTPAAEESAWKDAPFDPHYDLETHYESDSDEGSLFTLSSEGSEAAGSVVEGQTSTKEDGGASPAPHVGNSEEHMDSVTPVTSLKDFTTFQRGKRETQDHPGSPHTSGPDASVYETHPESAANTRESEDPLTDATMSCPETPGSFAHGYDPAAQLPPVEWLGSLRFLLVSDADVSSPHSAEDASDPKAPPTKET